MQKYHLINWGVKTDIKASVPLIAEGKVEINIPTLQEYLNGEK